MNNTENQQPDWTHSVTATSFDNHFSETFQHYTGVVIVVEESDGAKLGGCTAWLGHVVGFH